MTQHVPFPKAFDRTALVGRKILIIVENLPVPFDRRVWQESLALVSAGAEVSVICPKGKGYEADEEVIEGVRVYRHALPWEGDSALGYLQEYLSALLHQSRLAWRLYFNHGFDAIHGCNPPDLVFLVALPFKLLGKKFVFDHHDICPELYEAKFNKRGFYWRLLVLLERLTFSFSDIVISTNESYRRIAIERGRKRPDRVFVVRSGPDLRRVRVMPVDPKWKKGRTYLVGFVGVIGRQEGLDLLLESVKYIVRDLKREDIQFVLVGDGPSRKRMEALSVEMGLADYVTFLGRAPDDELFSVLSTADVCVNPDRVNPMNNLSTMNKILEYMAMKKPIVQFEVVEGRVSAEEASVYAKPNDPIDFADKIVALIADPARRAEAGEVGRNRIENELSWAHQIPNLIGAYTTLFKR
ncbi:glycosyltransferase family 4 protein [Roseiarcus sp.]|uniref:glycosyltransferase family 4 protein n=1 Tax=Roseiarcus sp. TaxID=1969460 RepID=UPI003F9A1F83